MGNRFCLFLRLPALPLHCHLESFAVILRTEKNLALAAQDKLREGSRPAHPAAFTLGPPLFFCPFCSHSSLVTRHCSSAPLVTLSFLFSLTPFVFINIVEKMV
jgi:hypothetical protein